MAVTLIVQGMVTRKIVHLPGLFFPLSVFKLRLVRPMGTKFHWVWGASCNQVNTKH